MRKHIPNLLTLGNLFFGCLAIVLLFSMPGGYVWPYVAGLMGLSLLCDFLDGFVARLLGVASPLGKELDSLADLVTFGLLPGLLVMKSIQMLINPMLAYMIEDDPGIFSLISDPAMHLDRAHWLLLPLTGLLIPVFSAYRLAKFNLDTRQSYGFLGLPTPANSLFFLGIYVGLHEWMAGGIGMDVHAYFGAKMDYLASSPAFPEYAIGLAVLALVFSILLISELPLMALKFKNFSFTDNWHKYLLLTGSAVLLILFGLKALSGIILLYLLSSIPEALARRRNE